MNLFYIGIALAVLVVVYIIATYNGFIVLKTRIEEAFSGIDVQLKRRADLIPNLIQTVKGYVKHEKQLFESVTKARSSLVTAKTPNEKAQANDQLSSVLKSLFAVAEAYPQLQASSNFQELQRQLEDTEDKIAYARQFYNSNVLEYNTKVRSFPSNIIASFLHFNEKEFFETTEQERKNVKVDFQS